MFQDGDNDRKHNILNEVSKLIDNGKLKTLWGNFGTIKRREYA